MEKLEKLEKQKAQLSKKLEGLREEYRLLGNKISPVYKKLQEVESKIDEELISGRPVNWELLLEETGNSSLFRYRAAEKELAKFSMWSSGYNPTLNQRCITLLLERNSSPKQLKKMEKGINTILPFLKAEESKNGEPSFKKITIGGGGRNQIWFGSDNSIGVYATLFFEKPRLIQNFSDTLDAIEFCKSFCCNPCD